MDELSLTLSPCENKISCLKTFKLKLTAMNQLWNISPFQEKDKISQILLIKIQTLESFVLFKDDKAKDWNSELSRICYSCSFLHSGGPGGQELSLGYWMSHSTAPARPFCTANTSLHLHKNSTAREDFMVTCTVTLLGKQVIARLKDVPVLKTQTCNWNHSNSFHELFRTHTTQLAQPRYPQRSFFLCSLTTRCCVCAVVLGPSQNLPIQ